MRILNMIVKDEEEVISRCLDSVSTIIDGTVICDTGSTDKTVVITDKWRDDNQKSGTIHHHVWKNFEHNRNLALDAAKEWIYEHQEQNDDENVDEKQENEDDPQENPNYICFIDADDYLVISNKEELNKSLEVGADKYLIKMVYGGTSYYRTFMIKSNLESQWRGVLHESLYCQAKTTEKLNGAHIVINRDGARNKDPIKYLKDATVLETALIENPNDPRYLFYLAQSYKDFDYKQLAEQIYLERFDIPVGGEERYISLLEAGKCRIYRGKNDLKTLNIFMKAFNFRPSRMEAPFYILRYFRENKLYFMGYNFGKSFLLESEIQSTSDNLFIENDIYDWKFYDELGVCAFWCGDKNLFKILYRKILDGNVVPQISRERIENDLRTFAGDVVEPDESVEVVEPDKSGESVESVEPDDHIDPDERN